MRSYVKSNSSSSEDEIVHRVTVELGERSYQICIGTQTLSTFPEACASHYVPHHIAVVTDIHVRHLYLRQLSNALRHHGFKVHEVVISAGEKQKSLSHANSIFTKLIDGGLTRESALIAFGGGVVGDVTGFVAATYRRGVMLIQVPTTLLAQVESAIGGKTGVNHPRSKNAIGAFYQPKFVFSDVNLLSTLPRREIICGLGEALKYAILSEKIFCLLDENLDEIVAKNLEVLQELILQCNSFKAKLISEDERELNPAGGRLVLNLGHTIGHALENLSNYKLHHGEAVLVGLKWELLLAKEAQIVSKNDFERINALLNRINYCPDLRFLSHGRLVRAVFSRNGKARFVLPNKVGEVFVTEEIEASLVQAVLDRISC